MHDRGTETKHALVPKKSTGSSMQRSPRQDAFDRSEERCYCFIPAAYMADNEFVVAMIFLDRGTKLPLGKAGLTRIFFKGKRKLSGFVRFFQSLRKCSGPFMSNDSRALNGVVRLNSFWSQRPPSFPIRLHEQQSTVSAYLRMLQTGIEQDVCPMSRRQINNVRRFRERLCDLASRLYTTQLNKACTAFLQSLTN
jgi:hypothetical protein